MDNYLVSIILPIYNVEKYLDRCIQSILNQSYENLEIILVDDGSPDRSSEICDEYRKSDQRIKVVHKENGGLSDARNAGLILAKGKYIIFLDSDDYIEHTMVEDAVTVLEKNNSDIVIWGYYADFVDEDENLISSKIINPCISGDFLKSDFYEVTITNELIGILGYAWNKMYKKSLLLKNNFKFTKGLSLVEDIVFNGPVLTSAERISFIEKPYVHYMQRSRETLGTKFYENYYELKKMAMNTVESMLSEWGKTDCEISKIKSNLLYNTLKSTTRLLSKAENYTKDEKDIYLKTLLNKSDVQDTLSAYSPKNHKDRLIKFLMLKRQSNLLLYMYSGR